MGVASPVFCTSSLKVTHGVQEMGKDIHEVTNVDLLPCAGLHGGLRSTGTVRILLAGHKKSELDHEERDHGQDPGKYV